MAVDMTTLTTSATSGTATSKAATTAKAATVDYNAFLGLLVQQLKNQDPTAPSDPTTFMAQLASFSQVEQQVQSNAKLDQLLTTNSLSQAESVIGRIVSSSDGTTAGKVTAVAIATDGTATATLDTGSTLALGSGITVSAS